MIRSPTGARKPPKLLRTPTPLESDLHEAKWYAPGVGQILTLDLDTGEKSELIRIEFR